MYFFIIIYFPKIKIIVYLFTVFINFVYILIYSFICLQLNYRVLLSMYYILLSILFVYLFSQYSNCYLFIYCFY